ncbi:MAG: ComEC family competence protein [Prevotellaceae bacterium]|jgi:competence protein ComEC|nr:ComEC family competence protein [Prevotellaceae bacterium]
MDNTAHIGDDAGKFLRKTPFFRLLLALVCGIAFQVVAGFYLSVFIIIVSLGILLILSGFLFKDFRLRWACGAGMYFLLFSLGLFLTQKADEHTQFQYLGQPQTYLAKIISAPTEKPRSVLCELRLQQNLDKNETLTNNVIVYLEKDSLALTLQAGERILVNAAFDKSRPRGNPDEFDYARYLKHKGICAVSYVSAAQWQKVQETPPFSIINFAAQCRDKLLSICKTLGISGDEYGVLAALTLGYREDLSQDLNNSYAAAGVTHVLSVSGLHVGVIYIVINFLLGFMDKRRETKVAKAVLIIALLWLYALITGVPPSVIRSAFMLSLITFSEVLNRKSQIFNTVFVSAFFMLVYNPYYLFDVGFQLSYLAVLGIVYYQPKFADLWKTENKYIEPVWSLLTVSLAAQLVTTPLSLYYFHNFPNYFWLSNIVIVPASSGIIYLAFGLFFGSQIPYLNDIATFLLTWAVRIVNHIILFISNLPYALLRNVWIDGWTLAIIFAIIICFTIAFVYRKNRMFIAGLALVAVFLSINVYENCQSATNGNKLIVASMQDGYGVYFIEKNKSYLLTDNETEASRAMAPYLMKNRIAEPVLPDSTVLWYDTLGFVSFAEKRILLLSENIFEKNSTENPLSLDYLVLTNNLYVKNLAEFVTPKCVIVDKSYKKQTIEKIKSDCAEMGINYYAIWDSGAFIAEWE